MSHGACLLHVALALIAAAGTAWAQEPPEGGGPGVSSTITVDLLSRYVWRGLRLSEGPVAQPSVTVQRGGLSMNAWWSCDYPSLSGRAARVTETDVVVSYAGEAGRVTITGGLIYYGLRGAPDTSELYASVGREMPLNPTFAFYYDVDEGDGALALFSVGQDLALAGEAAVSLTAAASFNMNHKVMGPGTNGEPFVGPYHGELRLSAAVPVARRLTLSPRIAYTFPLTNQAAHAMKAASWGGRTSTLLSGGVSVVVEF